MSSLFHKADISRLSSKIRIWGNSGHSPDCSQYRQTAEASAPRGPQRGR